MNFLYTLKNYSAGVSVASAGVSAASAGVASSAGAASSAGVTSSTGAVSSAGVSSCLAQAVRANMLTRAIAKNFFIIQMLRNKLYTNICTGRLYSAQGKITPDLLDYNKNYYKVKHQMMICIPLKSENFKKLMKDFCISQKFGDLVEIWFDELPEKDLTEKNLGKIFSFKKKPIIYKTTLPAEQEGAVLRRKELIKYMKKIDYIDLDIKTPDHLIKTIKKLSPKSKIIISYHNFKSTPKDSELAKIAKKCIEKGADIVKIATFAKTVSDSIKMLKFLEQQAMQSLPFICLCMGEKGRITRMAGHLFGNYLMYAPLELGEKTAEGQMDIKELTSFQNLIK